MERNIPSGAEIEQWKKDSLRLQWAWQNPDKFVEAKRTTPTNLTGRQQIDAAMKIGKK